MTKDSKEVYYEVGPGWEPIALEAVIKLQAMGATINQVKEKFGGLRIYYHMPNDGDHTYVKPDRIVAEAEAKCAVTCDRCGLEGKMRNDRWLRVRCDKHA